MIVNGLIQLCSPGCSSCATGTCTSCFSGYIFNSNSATCLRCGPNCLTCSSSNANQCLTCINGSYLSGTNCQPCSPTCITCSGTASSCQTCLPGQYYSGSSCAPCSLNCFNCSSFSQCITCNNGFVLAKNGKCRGCSMSCSSCSSTNITQCTSCANGLELINSACVSCPINCISCNNGQCATCVTGYQPNTNGICVLNCQLLCATCQDNLPTVCTSCYSGSTLNGSNCQMDLSCNANSTCTDCGQGLNYILVGTTCVMCPAITNCLQCSSSNTSTCSICSAGYYVDTSNGCTICSNICISCISSSICTGCAQGYTLTQGQTQGLCLQCASPCATCLGSSTFCQTCITNYTKIGWKCQSNNYVGFTFVLNADAASVMNNIDAIYSQMAGISGNSSNTGDITFTSITSGSTILAGTITGMSSAAVSSSLGTGVAIGGFTISSASVVGYGTAVSSTDSNGTTNSLPLILGLSIGLPLFASN